MLPVKHGDLEGDLRTKKPPMREAFLNERETRFELATPTLARL